VVGVRFDAVEEIIVGGVKQISDGRQIVTAVAESLWIRNYAVMQRVSRTIIPYEKVTPTYAMR